MLNPKTVAEAMEAGWKDLAVRCNACGHEAHVSWASWPRIGRLDRIPDNPEGRFATFHDVQSKGWHSGRAAISPIGPFPRASRS